MKLKLCPLACLLLFASLPLTNVSAQNAGTEETLIRRGIVSEGDAGRLRKVFEKARRGEPVTVGAIGGSITAGGLQTKDPKNRYIQQVAKWFEAHFPTSKITFINAGIGGTNSFYGAMRLERDLLSKDPDLVIVEWAVNNHASKDFAESYEGVLRRLLKSPRNIAVIELFFMHKNGESAQMWQEILGRHYQLPMVSFRDAWFPDYTAGRAQWEELYADVVHPNDAGHLLAAKLLTNLLDKSLQPGAAPAATAEIPAVLLSDLYERCRFSAHESLQPSANSGWSRSSDQKAWETEAEGSSIEFEFHGSSLFVGYDFEKEKTTQAVFSIDGGSPQPLKEDAHRRPLASNLGPGGHKVRIELQKSKQPGDAAGKLKIWGVGGAVGPEGAPGKQ